MKFKISRQIGENIWQTKKLTTRQKRILLKIRRPSAKSNFFQRFQTFRKLRIFYGTKPKQSLLNMEKRLDVILVRMNFCSNLSTARQWINHGFIKVNFSKVTIPSMLLTNGDIVSVCKNFIPFVKKNMQKIRVFKKHKLSHLEVNYKLCIGILLFEPQSVIFPSYFERNIISTLRRG
uniref:Ribosomal protein S4 n=1 Tax=Chaetosphaeridium globosum TaxID=96477 RepID=Q8M1G7_CHAGL|nr:ribosomal protein S4 [Chaetosphaeridium globosum]AAM96626.1 ribosomal protein S4 [Chaetosphaeridium globosum]